MQCPQCGHHNQEGALFCARCGTASLKARMPSTLLGQSSHEAPTAPAVVDALIGRTIEGKYRLEARLGEGGMGAVYQSTRLLIGDQVAVKVLHLDQAADPAAAERFRREAQAAARVQHPNAVTIYDFGVSNEGLVYLVMELIAGQSLRHLLHQSGPLPLADAASIITQVCGALDAAHEQHVVHRDIKPDNIIVREATGGWRVKVLDFGIAKLTNLTATTDQLTLTGSVIGTPNYMSPEQCLGEELDQRSDIYSLGVMLYEMLTGVVPFNATTWGAVIVQHVNQQPPPLSSFKPGLPAAAEAVVLRALAKDRAARPQTAGMLARELEAAAAYPTARSTPPQFPIASPPGPTPPQFRITTPSASTPPAPETAPILPPTVVMKVGAQPKWDGEAQASSRPRRLALLLAGAALVLALAGAGLWWAFKPSDNSSTLVTSSTPEPPPGMVYVPGGELMMGNNAGDEYERPAHQVSVKPFFIDRHEVTVEDYQKFVAATRRDAPRGWPNGVPPPGAARRPVTGVTWDDAVAYAQWAGKRLPAEAEWEFAARSADGRRYPWGNDWRPGYANADTTSINHLADVGSHSAGASPFGALDLVGNAWEWTANDLTAYPRGQLKIELAGDLKVIRGGAWSSNREVATTTYRRGYPARGSDYSNTGFRCAKDLSESQR